ncbi:peptidase S8/S53 domain-containing protein [Cantharellus anzutake]|uniref:peptidase S8/S53 domain-containing protein n=1 Tax=Cantharellus anzutake TaxID=1750568 RepID=UPI001904FB51|nr:peptidase S8/S53 domain-containing protein [Cantharellus anzutake]KAF8326611.1 peptidase S8/S53 domain-containing protein [Cantharellus anzutake]
MRATALFLSFILPLVIPVSANTFNAPDVIPSLWQLLSIPPLPNTPIEFTLVLAPSNRDGLQSRMKDIALAPLGSPGRRWLTQQDVAGYVGATPQVRSSVESVLAAIPGATFEFNSYGDQVTVHTIVGEAAKFLSAIFLTYQHDSGPSVIRAHSVTIPPSISDAVIDIFPLLAFGQITPVGKVNPVEPRRRYRPSHARRAATHNGNNLMTRAPLCDVHAITLQCIRTIYSLNDYIPPTPSASDPPSIGVMGYIEESYNSTDLKTYLTKYRPEAQNYSIDVQEWNGGKNNQSNPGYEASLDVQTVAGLVWPLKSTFYDVGSGTLDDLFLYTFQQFLAMDALKRPAVISVSYGYNEYQLTKQQANTMCAEAEKLTAEGTTIIFSAGDNGVYKSSSRKAPGDPKCPPFRPTYPSGCPYILSVGSTEGLPKSLGGDGERATGRGKSTGDGGTAANHYIRFLKGRENGNYNKTGRAYPDVSAQGSHQLIVVDGDDVNIGGTSASAPIFASIITLINARIRQLYGEDAGGLGWVHPLFYLYPGIRTAWNDVVNGGSYGCDGDAQGIGGPGNGGFPATHGWDASTGWGTIDFVRFWKALEGL